jgi:hypothetical protein
MSLDYYAQLAQEVMCLGQVLTTGSLLLKQERHGGQPETIDANL